MLKNYSYMHYTSVGGGGGGTPRGQTFFFALRENFLPPRGLIPIYSPDNVGEGGGKLYRVQGKRDDDDCLYL